MRAVLYSQGKLLLAELPEPHPGPGEVKVRVRYASICGSDLFLLSSGRLKEGTVLGHEMSGQVEEVGQEVEDLSPGQPVIVRPVGCGRCPPCREKRENLCPKRLAIGLGDLPGAFTQYIVVPKEMIIPVPSDLDLSLAALAEPLATALHAVRVSGIDRDDRVLIIGAGGIGLSCVCVLKALGVKSILVSEPVPGRRNRALLLGAQRAIDPKEQDLFRACLEFFGGLGPTAVIECAGNAQVVDEAMRILLPGGKLVLVGLSKGKLEWAPAVSMLKELRIQGSFANTQAECRECLQMMAWGKIQGANMVEREVPLEELPRVVESLMVAPGDGKVLVRVS